LNLDIQSFVFVCRAFHVRSLLTDKTVTTESIVNNVHCINPRGKYDRKIGTCGQAHKFAVVQMTRHSFNEMSTVSHEMYNFLSPEASVDSLVQNNDRVGITQGIKYTQVYSS
jgi:hypothetical protein